MIYLRNSYRKAGSGTNSREQDAKKTNLKAQHELCSNSDELKRGQRAGREGEWEQVSAQTTDGRNSNRYVNGWGGSQVVRKREKGHLAWMKGAGVTGTLSERG